MRRFENLDHLSLPAKYLQQGIQSHAIDSGGGSGQNDPSCFSLFVESDDPRIGIFAASFAAHLLNNFMLSLPGEDDRELLTQVAGLIHDYPETQREIARLTGDLNESVANINTAIQELAQVDSGGPWFDR